MFSNNKQTLEIQLSTDGINHTGLPLVTVYSRFLTKVENSGDSLVRVATVEPTPSFRARLIGNGQISIRNIDTNYLDASLETGNGVMAISGSAAKAKYSPHRHRLDSGRGSDGCRREMLNARHRIRTVRAHCRTYCKRSKFRKSILQGFPRKSRTALSE